MTQRRTPIRLSKNGKPAKGEPCPHDECGRPVKQNGLCQMHEARLSRRGSLELVRWGVKPTDAVLAARLLEKTTPEPNSGCVIWLGSIKDNGYGTMWDGFRHQHVHRLSYMLHHGPIPDGLVVCHRCDVRCCVNPGHLWLGTTQDNMDDMMRKGRRREGRHDGLRNGRARLTPEAVAIIRAAPKGYGTGRALAQRFGVSEGAIWHARNGNTWQGEE